MDIFQGYGVEIRLAKRSDFLVVKETLTRMGLPDVDNKKLFQACHILHKQARYVIIHHRELSAFDGKKIVVSNDDIAIRNKIVSLLSEWNLVTVVGPNTLQPTIGIHEMKILNFKEKDEWTIESRHVFKPLR